MFVLLLKPLRNCGSISFYHFFTQFREREYGSQGSFITPVFFEETRFPLIFTFQPYYLIIPRSGRQIYVEVGKISTGSEKLATGSESNPCRHLLITTGLLPESGWTCPSEGRNYKLFFVSDRGESNIADHTEGWLWYTAGYMHGYTDTCTDTRIRTDIATTRFSQPSGPIRWKQ